MLEKYDVHVIPVGNPDGYQYSRLTVNSFHMVMSTLVFHRRRLASGERHARDTVATALIAPVSIRTEIGTSTGQVSS